MKLYLIIALSIQLSIQIKFFYNKYENSEPLNYSTNLGVFKEVNSHLDCLIRCNQALECLAFKFNKLNLDCIFFDKSLKNVSPSNIFDSYSKRLPNGFMFLNNSFSAKRVVSFNGTVDDIEEIDSRFFFLSIRDKKSGTSNVLSKGCRLYFSLRVFGQNH